MSGENTGIAQDLLNAYNEILEIAGGTIHFIKRKDFLKKFGKVIKDSGVKQYTMEEVKDLIFTTGEGIIFKDTNVLLDGSTIDRLVLILDCIEVFRLGLNECYNEELIVVNPNSIFKPAQLAILGKDSVYPIKGDYDRAGFRTAKYEIIVWELEEISRTGR